MLKGVRISETILISKHPKSGEPNWPQEGEMNFDKWGFALGRVFLSVIFILSGIFKLIQFSAVAGMMASKGIPLASVALAITLVIEIGGGLLLLTGFKAQYAAMVMALFLVPVTLVFHNFWAFQGQQQQEQMTNFLKNLAIIGGLLVASSLGQPASRAKSAAGGQ
jgi:putative oxidoreductase